MVRLGFIKNINMLPDGFWNVVFRISDNRGSALNAAIHAQPGVDEVLKYELFLDVPSGHEKVNLWVPGMADRLIAMGLTRFSFDPETLAQALDLHIADALSCWGFPFFEHYAIESQVLLQVGQHRRVVYQMVTQWCQQLTHVRFDPDLDYDTLAESDQKRKKISKSRKNFFRSLLFGRQT